MIPLGYLCDRLQRAVASFAGTDADNLFQVANKDLAVTDLAGVGGFRDGVDHLIDDVIADGGFKFKLNADKDLIETGFSGNLIVEAVVEVTPKQQKGKPKPKNKKYSAGFLPAIPVQIAQKTAINKE